MSVQLQKATQYHYSWRQ